MCELLTLINVLAHQLGRVMRNVAMMTTWAESCWRCSCQENKTGKTREGVFGCGEGGHVGKKMKCLTEVYGESAVATPDGKAERRRRQLRALKQPSKGGSPTDLFTDHNITTE